MTEDHTPIDATAANKKLALAGIPLKYRHAGLEDWRPYNSYAAEARTAAELFVEDFGSRWGREDSEAPTEHLGRGLAIVGTPGAGKTRLLCAVLREVHVRHGVAVMFVAIADYIAALVKQIAIKPQADKGIPEAVKAYWDIEAMTHKVRGVPFVGIDDLGKEHRTASAFATDEIDRLLRYRHRHARPTGVSTNKPLEEWSKLYDPAMTSFAHEAFEQVALGGKDMRRG